MVNFYLLIRTELMSTMEVKMEQGRRYPQLKDERRFETKPNSRRRFGCVVRRVVGEPAHRGVRERLA